MLTMVIGKSMEPTLYEGELWYVKKLRTRDELHVGDIVVAKIDGKMVVKRIAKIRYIRNIPLYDLHGDNKKVSKNFESVFRSNIKYKLGRPFWVTKYMRKLKNDYYMK